MQGSEVRVNFVVMRATEAQEEGGRGARRPEPQYFRRRSAYVKVGANMTGTVSALVCFRLTRVFLLAPCDCNACSFVNHTRSRHTQWKDPPTPPGFGESRHLRHRVEMKVPLGPPVLIKRPGVLLALPRQGHSSVVFGSFFAWLRIKADNSYYFRLQSHVCSSCLGGGEVLGWEKEAQLPHPPKRPPLIVYRLQKPKLLFSTHLFPYESLVLILTPLLYSSLSDPSHVFHICFYVWICERNC